MPTQQRQGQYESPSQSLTKFDHVFFQRLGSAPQRFIVLIPSSTYYATTNLQPTRRTRATRFFSGTGSALQHNSLNKHKPTRHGLRMDCKQAYNQVETVACAINCVVHTLAAWRSVLSLTCWRRCCLSLCCLQAADLAEVLELVMSNTTDSRLLCRCTVSHFYRDLAQCCVKQRLPELLTAAALRAHNSDAHHPLIQAWEAMMMQVCMLLNPCQSSSLYWTCTTHLTTPPCLSLLPPG